MPTSVNSAIADQDLSRYFTAGDDDTIFHFCGSVPYTVVVQRGHFDFINGRKQIIRDVAAASQVRLIDLFEEFTRLD